MPYLQCNLLNDTIRVITVIPSNYSQRHLLCFLWRCNDKSLCNVCANIVVQSDRLEWDRMEYDNTESDRVGVEDRFKRSYSTGKVQPSLIQRQVIRFRLTRLITEEQSSSSAFYNVCFFIS